MSKLSCVNRNSHECKQLQRELNASGEELAKLIEQYMSKNGTQEWMITDKLLIQYLKARLCIGTKKAYANRSDAKEAHVIWVVANGKKFSTMKEAEAQKNTLLKYFNSEDIAIVQTPSNEYIINISEPIYSKPSAVNALENQSETPYIANIPYKANMETVFNGIEIKEGQEISVKDVVANIRRMVGSESMLNTYLTLLMRAVNSNTMVRLYSDPSSKVAGEHIAKADNSETIVINISHPVNNVDVVGTFLHELVHAATFKSLMANPEMVKATNELMSHAIDEANNRGINMTSEYGFTNAFEFMAEALTNRQFQALLKSIKPVDKKRFNSFFHELFSLVAKWINRITGMNYASTLLDQVAAITYSVVEEQAFPSRSLLDRTWEVRLAKEMPLDTPVTKTRELLDKAIELNNQRVFRKSALTGRSTDSHSFLMERPSTMSDIEYAKYVTIMQTLNDRHGKQFVPVYNSATKWNMTIDEKQALKRKNEELTSQGFYNPALGVGSAVDETLRRSTAFAMQFRQNNPSFDVSKNLIAERDYVLKQLLDSDKENHIVNTSPSLLERFVVDSLYRGIRGVNGIMGILAKEFGPNFYIYSEEVPFVSYVTNNSDPENPKKEYYVGIPDLIIVDSDGIPHIVDIKSSLSTKEFSNEKLYGGNIDGIRTVGYNTQTSVYKNAVSAALRRVGFTEELGKTFYLRITTSYKSAFLSPSDLEDEYASNKSYYSMDPVSGQFYQETGDSSIPIPIEETDNYNFGMTADIVLTEAEDVELNAVFETLSYEDQAALGMDTNPNTTPENSDDANAHNLPHDSVQSKEDKQSESLHNEHKLAASERTFLAHSAIIKLSEMVSNIINDPTAAVSYFGPSVAKYDFTKMERAQVIKTLGLKNMLKWIKEFYFNPNGFLGTLDTPGLQNHIYNEDSEFDDDVLDKFQIAYNNWDALMDTAFSKLISMEGITILKNSQYIDQEFSDEFFERIMDAADLEEKDREYWQQGFRQVSAKSSLSKEIRRVLEKIKIVDVHGNSVLDPQFGFETYVNVNEAVTSLLKWCTDCLTIEEMEASLKDASINNPWVRQILELIKNEPGNAFRQQFFQNFRKDCATYSIVRRVKNAKGQWEYVTQIINTRSVSDTLLKSIRIGIKEGRLGGDSIARKKGKKDSPYYHGLFNVIDPATGQGRVNIEGLNSISKEREELSTIFKNAVSSSNKNSVGELLADNQFISRVHDLLIKGFGFPVELISQDAIKQAFLGDRNKRNYNVTAFSKMMISLDGILSSMKSTINENGIAREDYDPFERDTETGVYNNYRTVSELFSSVLPETVEASVYENGKMHYSFTTPSQIQKTVSSFKKSGREFQSWIQKEYGKYEGWFKVGDVSSKNGDGTWLCPWLSDIMNSEGNKNLLEHKIELAFDKIAYKELSKVSYALSTISNYFQGGKSGAAWYRVPVLGNKPSSEFIRFRKFSSHKQSSSNPGMLSYQATISSKLKSVFHQELIRMKTVFAKALDEESVATEFFDITKEDAEKYRDVLQKIADGKVTHEDLFKDGNYIFEKARGSHFQFLRYINKHLQANDEVGKYIIDKLNSKELNIQEEIKGDTLIQQAIFEGVQEQSDYVIQEWQKIGLMPDNNNLNSKECWEIDRAGKPVLKYLGQYAHSYDEITASLFGGEITKVLAGRKASLNSEFADGVTYRDKILSIMIDASHERRDSRNSDAYRESLQKMMSDKATNWNEKQTKEKIKAAINEFVKLEIANEVSENIREFVWNDHLASINIIQLTVTDLAFFKNSEDFQKRFPQVHSPFMRGDVNALDMDTSHTANNGKVSDGMNRNVYLVDENMVSDSKINALEVFEAKKRNAATPSEAQMWTTIQSVVDSAFSKFKSTDGQAYSSPTSYRKKMHLIGKWTPEMEEAYKEICSGNLNLNNVGILLQPFKPFGAGYTSQTTGLSSMPYQKTPIQYKNSEYLLFIADAIIRSETDKTGKPNTLTALFDFMEDSAFDGRVMIRGNKIYQNGRVVDSYNEYTTSSDGVYFQGKKVKDGTIIEQGTYNGQGIDTVQFHSCIKEGSSGLLKINGLDYHATRKLLHDKTYINSDKSVGTLRDGNPSIYDDRFVHAISFEDYGFQQEVPAHLQNHNQLYGSQVRILGFTDISDDPQLRFLVGLGQEQMSKKEIISEFQDLVKKNLEESFEELKRDFMLSSSIKRQIIKETVLRRIFKDISAGKYTASHAVKGYTNKSGGQSPSVVDQIFDQLQRKHRLSSSEKDKALCALLKNAIEANAKKGMSDEEISSNISDIMRNISANTRNLLTVTQEEKNEALSAVLEESILKDGRYGSDLLRACRLNEQGQFVIPLSDPIQSIRIQQLLNSIIKTRLNKQTIKGGPVVQASSYGISEDLDIIFNDSNGKPLPTFSKFCAQHNLSKTSPEAIHKYKSMIQQNQGGVAYFECYMPVSDIKLQKALTKPDGSFMTVEEALEAKIMTEEMLQAIGYRIPTEDKYSMYHMKIKGFVPATAGEVLILPKEITVLTGSDFDIDKTYIILKEFKSKKESEYFDVNKAKQLLSNTDVKGIATTANLQAVSQAIKSGSTDGLSADQMSLYSYVTYDLDAYMHREFYVEQPGKDKKGKPVYKNRAMRNNRLFDLQWSVLSNADTMEKMFNPQSFDTQKKAARIIQLLRHPETTMSFEELNKLTLDQLDDMLSRVSKNDITFIDTQIRFHNQNMVAAKMVGIFANNNVSHGFLSLLADDPQKAIAFNFANGVGFSINNYEIGYGKDSNNILDKQRGLDGTLISKTIASYLAASVDAVKDPVLGDLNLNPFTSGAAMVLARLGFNCNTISLLMNQPIILKITDEYFKRNNEGFVSAETLVEEEINRLRKEFKESTSAEDNSAEKMISITDEELVRGIREGKESSSSQIDVLRLFKQLTSMGNNMNTLTFITKFNSVKNAAGPDIADTLVMQEKYNSFINDMTSKTKVHPFSRSALHIFENIPLLGAFYNTTVGPEGAAQALFDSTRFPHYTQKFQGILSEVRGRLKSPITNKIINMLANDFMLYKLTANYDDFTFFSQHSSMREYYTGVNDKYSFIKDFLEFKRKHPKNALLQIITVKDASESCPVETLETKTGGFTIDEQERIKDAWSELINSEESRDFAQKLFFYNMQRSGFAFSPKTFMHLASVDVKLAMPHYIELISNTEFGNEKVLVASFLDQFFRNHANDFKLVPRVDVRNLPYSTFDITETGNTTTVDLSFSEDKVYQPFIISGSKPLNSEKAEFKFCPYIMIDDVLYKFKSSESASGLRTVHYEETTTLGNPFNFLEYNAEDVNLVSVLGQGYTSSYEEGDGQEETDYSSNFETTESTEGASGAMTESFVSTVLNTIENVAGKTAVDGYVDIYNNTSSDSEKLLQALVIICDRKGRPGYNRSLPDINQIFEKWKEVSMATGVTKEELQRICDENHLCLTV